jgi:hypothetical protein
MRISRLPMIARLSFLPRLFGLPVLGVVTLALGLFGGAARATPVVYQFTAGSYNGWLSYDPTTAVIDPNYTTPTSAVYRGDIRDMYATLTDNGTVYTTFNIAAVVLDGAGGYYGLEFSGLSQWGHVDIDMFYYGSYEPITSTNLPLSIDQTGLSLFVYIGGQQATNANQQLSPTIQISNTTPPVPEPSSVLLMGLGLICLAGFRKHLARR